MAQRSGWSPVAMVLAAVEWFRSAARWRKRKRALAKRDGFLYR